MPALREKSITDPANCYRKTVAGFVVNNGYFIPAQMRLYTAGNRFPSPQAAVCGFPVQ